jgi:hypothetical protein
VLASELGRSPDLAAFDELAQSYAQTGVGGGA